jgi:hypothetical protein
MPPSSASLSSASPALTRSTLQRPGPTLDQAIAASSSKTAEILSGKAGKDLKDIPEGAATDPKTTSRNLSEDAVQTAPHSKEPSPLATASSSKPSSATQEEVFLELPYLATEPSSCIDLIFSERALAERQAEFHSRLCAQLEYVQMWQKGFRDWLAVRVKLGMSSPSDGPNRPTYKYPDTPPSPSQMRDAAGDSPLGMNELTKEDVDEDDGSFLSPSSPKQMGKRAFSNFSEDQRLKKPRF